MFNKMILNYHPKNLLNEGGTIFMKKKHYRAQTRALN